MKALILAAGRGSRLRERTDEHTKCMLPMFGKPLIQYSLENAVRAGATEIIVVVGYRAEQIINRFGIEFDQRACLAAAWIVEYDVEITEAVVGVLKHSGDGVRICYITFDGFGVYLASQVGQLAGIAGGQHDVVSRTGQSPGERGANAFTGANNECGL